ncbi:MAG TPA: DNA-processing protein DprA [Burkholderiales bacterium]
MPFTPDLEPWLRLVLVPGMSDDAVRRLLVAYGSPQRVLDASPAGVRNIAAASVAAALAKGAPEQRVEDARRWLSEEENHLVTLADEAYPHALLQLTDPPPVIYVKGRIELLNRAAIAVVGSRNATPQGMMTARSFAQALSDAGLSIVSGLALGIDTAAHEGGLSGRAGTLAVVGTGLDIVYPARNRDLAHRIAREGALVSEFPLGAPAIANHFPRRNRIISGLARACLVVEAALSSGSLITARLANEQGKDVFAIPGSIHSALSKGCHVLIKQGAKLVDSVQDILEELRVGTPMDAVAPEEDEVHPLLALMAFDPCDVDTLAARSGLAAGDVAALLTRFELEGRVSTLPGARYQRTH